MLVVLSVEIGPVKHGAHHSYRPQNNERNRQGLDSLKGFVGKVSMKPYLYTNCAKRGHEEKGYNFHPTYTVLKR
jgi:hypothetical protein